MRTSCEAFASVQVLIGGSLRFSVLTYNQENLILYTLESIRWQIEQFGSLQADEIVIYDDCSTDNTVAVCTQWFDCHHMDPTSFRVERSEENQGIVKNFLRAAKAGADLVNKIIAGDDLFSQENVYEVMSQDAFIVSSVATFVDDKVEDRFPLRLMELYKAKLNGRLGRIFNKKWERGNFLIAPGVFYPSAIFHDEALISEISKNHWVEDQPIWDYMFVKQGNASRIQLSNKCYVLYRGQGGISTSFNPFKKTSYQEEANRVESIYHPKRGNIVARNLRLIFHDVRETLSLKALCKRDDTMRGFLSGYQHSARKAQDHLLHMMERVEQYQSALHERDAAGVSEYQD